MFRQTYDDVGHVGQTVYNWKANEVHFKENYGTMLHWECQFQSDGLAL